MFSLFANAFPCGPSFVSPVFEYEHAPEDPFLNFAMGKIGIVKPSHRRIVLIAAYRYLAGGGYSDAEQKALVDVWEAEFNNKDFDDDDVTPSVKMWLEKRRGVVGKEEKVPQIYVERDIGGFDFFPNCTKNAFETAAQTLNDRVASHGSEDRHVKAWVAGQDKVFENCSSGRALPDEPNESMPVWLRKDRAYQMAAAEFYAMDYSSAKRRFADIALDGESPWQETSEYLVGRTLIRQGSTAKDKQKLELIYREAEQVLASVAARGGRFADSAEKLTGIIKYRMRPEERLRELAQSVTVGSRNFRQDLIDYNWLMDKFDKEAREREEKRKAAAKNPDDPATINQPVEEPSPEPTPAEGEIKFYLYADDYSKSWPIIVPSSATDEDAFAKAAEVSGMALTDKMKEQIRYARKEAYRGRFDENNGTEYQGGYYGDEPLSLGILPEFIRADDLTNWLFVFQTAGIDAYRESYSRWKNTDSDLWLLTAISKAETGVEGLPSLLEAADRVSRNSVAFPTIAYHRARLLIESGKKDDARALLDELIASGDDLPISTQNRFKKLRASIASGLDDYLKASLLRPFAFDWDGRSGTIDDFVNEQKSWWSAENYPNQSRAEYEKEVEGRFRNEKLWENRAMFDFGTVSTINESFPISLMIDAERSPSLPEYLRERFAMAIWTKAALIGDVATVNKYAPVLANAHPELKTDMDAILKAPTPVARQRAIIYLMLKNPMVSPYLDDGFGKNDNTFDNFDSNDWWCGPYEPEEGSTVNEEYRVKPPSFLSPAHIAAAKLERRKLVAVGDAPKYFGEKVLEWARLAPADKRVPESLLLVWRANGWTKYGCGSNVELRQQIGEVLKRRYPQSAETKTLLDEEKEEQ